jgi:hypothetical protein
MSRRPRVVLATLAPSILQVGLLAVLVLALGPLAEGATCTVPSGSYPTIQAAVDDPTCTDILLGSQTYAESVVVDRSVAVEGVSSSSTVIQGQVRVSSGSVVLDSLRVDTSSSALAGRFAAALEVADGAEVDGVDLKVVHRAVLFGDGFESNSTAAWSAVAP